MAITYKSISRRLAAVVAHRWMVDGYDNEVDENALVRELTTEARKLIDEALTEREARRSALPPPNPLLMATGDDSPAVPLNEPVVTREPIGGQELREAIKDTLFLYGIRGERLGSLRPGSLADAVLALPEIAALLADAERVRRVRELADRLDRGHWRDGVSYAKSIRRTLDGDQP